VELSAPMQAVGARAVARPVVAITVLLAVETLLQRTPLQYLHAEISAQRAAVKSRAVARLAADLAVGLTA
jgi:hypothetical protein